MAAEVGAVLINRLNAAYDMFQFHIFNNNILTYLKYGERFGALKGDRRA